MNKLTCHHLTFFKVKNEEALVHKLLFYKVNYIKLHVTCLCTFFPLHIYALHQSHSLSEKKSFFFLFMLAFVINIHYRVF